MQCPYCEYENTKVTDSRDTGVYSIRRRRECLSCHRRFTTYEHIEMSPIYIIKKDGRREKFEKNKIETGVTKALEKRPVSPEKIKTLLDNIEEHIRREGKEEIHSSRIGEFVMEELEKIDQVAYIRFASVYRAFADITHFQKEVQKLTKKP